MSRDYKSNKSSNNAKKSKTSFIFGMLIGYALGLMSAIGIWMYISESPSPFLVSEKDQVSSQTVLAPGELRLNPQIEGVNSQVDTAADTKNRFDFYGILPGVDEPTFAQAPEPVAQTHIPTPPQPSPPSEPIVIAQPDEPVESVQMEHYFLQVGSFRDADEAENQKARLALLGIVADIQSVDLAAKGIWYRVRVGPFIRMAALEEVRSALQQSGIDTHFIKISGNF